MSGVRRLLRAPAAEVAPALLGWELRHETDDGVVGVRLTEVEAYQGEQDPASHAYRGRTPRNEVMFGPAGHLYVYRSHGLHWCCNIVTGPAGAASAVLLRAGRVVEGLDRARSRRGATISDVRLARGPGCLCQALGITGAENGAGLLADGPLTLAPVGEPVSSTTTEAGPRVGVSRGHEVPWRFWVSGDPTVSAYRRSPRATPPTPTPSRE